MRNVTSVLNLFVKGLLQKKGKVVLCWLLMLLVVFFLALRFVARNYEKMKPLLHSDPLLQYTFITVCPMKDMVKLVGNLSPYLCVALLAKQLGKDTKKVLDRKVI